MSEDKPHILIAEDDAETRAILATAFSYWGYPLLVAADGDEALRLAQEHPIDMALLDVRMPGLSGLELAGKLHKIDPHILIIMMTAYVSAQDTVEATEQGALYYLPKPFTPSFVRGLVDDKWAAYLRGCREQIGEAWIDWRQQTVTVKGQTCFLHALSRREQAILDELIQGKTDARIAEALEIGLPTVRTHLRHITHKLKLNREQLLALWDRYRQRSRRNGKG